MQRRFLPFCLFAAASAIGCSSAGVPGAQSMGARAVAESAKPAQTTHLPASFSERRASGDATLRTASRAACVRISAQRGISSSGGAINSGPIGSLTSSLIIRSISAFAFASSEKSKTSETAST
jgi:hypothetical protein